MLPRRRCTRWSRSALGRPAAAAGRPWRRSGRDEVALDGVPLTGPASTPAYPDPVRTLYLLDVRTLKLRPLMTKLSDPSPGAWSPDGRLLAFSARHGGKRGLWVLDLMTRSLRLVIHGDRFGQAVWLNQNRLAVVISPVGDALAPTWAPASASRPITVDRTG